MKIARVLLFCLFTWLHGLVLHGPHGEKNSLIQEDFLKPATILIDDNGLSFGQGCGPNQKNPKLAICVAGLSRLFASDLAIPRLFQEEVLNKTSEAGAVGITRNLPDVFVHIKLGGNDRAKTENVVAAEMHATDFVVEDGDGTKLGRAQLGNSSCFHPGWSKGTISTLMSYYHSIQGCNDLLEKAEQEKGATFDHVIFMRPDHVWGDAAKEKQYSRKVHTSLGGAPVLNRIQCEKSLFGADLFAFTTRSGFRKFGNIYKDQFANKNPSFCSMHTGNEGMVVNAVTELNAESPQSAVYSDHRLVASGNGPPKF